MSAGVARFRVQSSVPQGSGTRLRRYALLIAVLVILGGCQASEADDPPPPRENVSLFGVRIGMTPDQLNTALPGAHCALTSEHSACEVPSTAMGSSGVNVYFSNGRVTWAYTEGGMGGGLRKISQRIAEQLGRSQQQRFDDTYADTWTAKDGSELALLAGHYITEPSGGDNPYARMNGYTLVLSSSASRTHRAQEREAAQQKIERDLTNTLGQILAIDSAGHVSVCGIRVGATFDGKLGCPPSVRAELLAGSGIESCNNMLGPHFSVDPLSPKRGLALRAPTAKVCVRVVTDSATRQVKMVSATLPSEAASASNINAAFVAVDNARVLDSGFTDYTDMEVLPSWAYTNAFGDVVTLAMGEDKFAIGKPLGESRKMLTVSITGKMAKASFN